jgi:hypothetical protein
MLLLKSNLLLLLVTNFEKQPISYLLLKKVICYSNLLLLIVTNLLPNTGHCKIDIAWLRGMGVKRSQ